MFNVNPQYYLLATLGLLMIYCSSPVEKNNTLNSTTDTTKTLPEKLTILDSLDLVSLKTPCSIYTDSFCMCEKRVLKCDTNIYLELTEPKMGQGFKDGKACYSAYLYLYKTKLSLDSIYHSNIKNKELEHWPGLIDLKCEKENTLLNIHLEFINTRINSSRSLSHVFNVKYNLNSHKIILSTITFYDGNTIDK